MEAFHPICRMYAGMSPVSCHVWMRDFRTRSGIGSNFFLFKDLAISRPRHVLKQLQFSLRRPQQLQGICRLVGFAALLPVWPGVRSQALVLALALAVALALALAVTLALALALALAEFDVCWLRFAARCFLMASRTRRRSSSTPSRASNLATGFLAACRAWLRSLRCPIA